jgi:hypothetical protein
MSGVDNTESCPLCGVKLAPKSRAIYVGGAIAIAIGFFIIGKQSSPQVNSMPAPIAASSPASPPALPARTSAQSWPSNGNAVLGSAEPTVVEQSSPTASVAGPSTTSATTSATTSVISSAESPVTPLLMPSAAPPTAESTRWRYSDSVDEMTSKRKKTASIDSENTLNLAFPYSGDNQPRLMLRKDGFGLNVMILIDKGQFMCQSYSPCSIEARFDDRPAMRFSGVGPLDGISTVAFVNNEKRFVKELKASKKMLLRVTIYQAGTQTLRFNTEGLKWE